MMMQRYRLPRLAAVLFVSCAAAWAQSTALPSVTLFTADNTGELELHSDGTMVFQPDDPNARTLRGTYTLSYQHSLPFLDFQGNPLGAGNWVALLEAGSNPTALLLYDRSAIDVNPAPTWYGRGFIAHVLGAADSLNVTSSSSLTEGSTVYGAANLFDVRDAHPWATKGSAVGQSITIGTSRPAGRPDSQLTRIDDLLFSIGYVSVAKPYLYDANSRPKAIRISDLDGRYSLEIQLNDTPLLQRVRLPSPSTGVKIEILSVYPGARWQDTCVNMILPIGTSPRIEQKLAAAH